MSSIRQSVYWALTIAVLGVCTLLSAAVGMASVGSVEQSPVLLPGPSAGLPGTRPAQTAGQGYADSSQGNEDARPPVKLSLSQGSTRHFANVSVDKTATLSANFVAVSHLVELRMPGATQIPSESAVNVIPGGLGGPGGPGDPGGSEDSGRHRYPGGGKYREDPRNQRPQGDSRYPGSRRYQENNKYQGGTICPHNMTRSAGDECLPVKPLCPNHMTPLKDGKCPKLPEPPCSNGMIRSKHGRCVPNPTIVVPGLPRFIPENPPPPPQKLLPIPEKLPPLPKKPPTDSVQPPADPVVIPPVDPVKPSADPVKPSADPVVAPPVQSVGSVGLIPWLWPVAVALILLGVGLLALLAVLLILRAVRGWQGQKWVPAHVHAVAGVAPDTVVEIMEPRTADSSPTCVVRIAPHADSGTQVLEVHQ